MGNGARVYTDFTKALIALATVVGTFVTALAANLLWVFWILLGAAILYAGARYAGPRLRAWWSERKTLLQQGRDYPRLLRVAGQHQARVQELEAELAAARQGATESRTEAIVEGRRRVIGELLGAGSDTELELVALARERDGLLLAAKSAGSDPPVIGSTWLLMVRGMALIHAVCRIREISTDGHALLEIVDIRDAASVAALKEQAATSNEVPNSLILRKRNFSSLADLEQES